MKKEVAAVRKKIDMANRDLKPLGQSCQKKVFAFIILSSSHLARSSVAYSNTQRLSKTQSVIFLRILVSKNV